ncbi:hypothetical protein B0H13DRAFT_1009221 [Mycena leptocephala]|nr:hypothetical protein B0H13DRAFT_1009221 [Mycena leptocephala]
MGRRILSPSQMAILVEEEGVLPRGSEDSADADADGDKEEGEVVVATRVSVSPIALAGPSAARPDETEAPKEKRRSWIPRFSWLTNRDSARSSRDIEEEGGLLLFDAGIGSGAHSPSQSMSEPAPPRLVSPAGSPPRSEPTPVASGSGSAADTMREFGARPLLPFLAALASSSRPGSRAAGSSSRPVSGAGQGSRPISGVSGMSSDGTGGTGGSGKSGGTVFTDARETLNSRAPSAQASFASRRTPGDEQAPPLPGQGQTQGQTHTLDPLDTPAPPALAAFSTTSSQASLHSQHEHERDHSGSLTHSASGASYQASGTLAGTASNTTLGTPATGHAPLKPERAYAHGPPGLGFDYAYSSANLSGGFASASPPPPLPAGAAKPHPSPKLGKSGSLGSVGSWDAAGLELGFARPPSQSLLGTFGSANAMSCRCLWARRPGYALWAGDSFAFGRERGWWGREHDGLAVAVHAPWRGVPAVRRGPEQEQYTAFELGSGRRAAWGGGRWRLLGASAHSLLGSSSSLGASQEWAQGPGRRDTFGLPGAAQYHPPKATPPSTARSTRASTRRSTRPPSPPTPVRGTRSSRPDKPRTRSTRPPAPARIRIRTARTLPACAPSHTQAPSRARSAPPSARSVTAARRGAFGSSGSGGAAARRAENSSGSGSGAGEHDRVRSPLSLSRARSPGEPGEPVAESVGGGPGAGLAPDVGA